MQHFKALLHFKHTSIHSQSLFRMDSSLFVLTLKNSFQLILYTETVETQREDFYKKIYVNLYIWLIVHMKPIEYSFPVFGKCIKETIK